MDKIMIIALDFDGTIVKDKHPKIGNFLPNFVKCYKNILYPHFELILNTCRTGKTFKEAINFLKDNNIILDAYNDFAPSTYKEYPKLNEEKPPKLYADIYIDNKNFHSMFHYYKDRYSGFYELEIENEVNWFTIENTLRTFIFTNKLKKWR